MQVPSREGWGHALIEGDLVLRCAELGEAVLSALTQEEERAQGIGQFADKEAEVDLASCQRTAEEGCLCAVLGSQGGKEFLQGILSGEAEHVAHESCRQVF